MSHDIDKMFSFVLILLLVILAYLFYQQYSQKEGLGTQNKLPTYFSPFTLNNIPLKMTYWANRLNGDGTTGSIDPYTVANDLKTTARTLNIVLYGDENGVNTKFIGMMSSLPFTINNLPFKMLTWANRLNGDSTGGTVDPQSIAHEIQYSSFLLNQALNGGAVEQPTEMVEITEDVDMDTTEPPIITTPIPTPTETPTTITPYQTTMPKTPTITPYQTTMPKTPTVTPSDIVYNITGNNTGNITGNITGNNTGNITGNISSITPYTYISAPSITPFSIIPSAFTTIM